METFGPDGKRGVQMQHFRNSAWQWVDALEKQRDEINRQIDRQITEVTTEAQESCTDRDRDTI